jgi:hypothetical protein
LAHDKRALSQVAIAGYLQARAASGKRLGLPRPDRARA